MPAIFISYRRSDAIDPAGRIYDRLTGRFPKREVFKDVDSIPLSVPFPEFLQETLRNTRVVLALIGPTWLDCRDSEGRRRLDDPGDFVRIELEAALGMGVPTIPVTVSHAAMPARESLPESLRPLVDRHGRPVRPDPDFHADVDRLIEGLTELLGGESVAAAGGPNRELLRELFDLAQRWHDEIIHTAAAVAATDDEKEVRRLEFVYIHSRRFLPRIESIRRLVAAAPWASGLNAALDAFFDLVTVRGASPSVASVACRSDYLYLGRGAPPANPLACLPASSWTTPGRADPAADISTLQAALQRISDEVILLNNCT